MNVRLPSSLGLAALAAGLLAVGHLASSPPADAGCLAPADVTIDSNGTVGPFWGSDSGSLLYAKLLSAGLANERDALMLRENRVSQIIVEQGDSTGDVLGSATERFETFHAGALNDNGDIALVASTRATADDPGTTLDDTIPRRTLLFRRGNSFNRVARFGDDSPILNVKWASIFDAAPSNRNPTFAEVTFSAQLGAPDGRVGIFVWSEASNLVTPLVLTGQASPAGGNFVNVGRMRVNGNGDAAFFALTQLGNDPVASGLFVREVGGLVFRTSKFGALGDAAPNGGRLSLLKDFDVDDSANVFFAAVLADTGPAGGIFRQLRGGAPLTVLLEGDSTPLGGRFDEVAASIVRCSSVGEMVIGTPLSEDIGGDAVFTIPTDSMEVLPLASTEVLLGVAALGSGRAAYQDDLETHTVIPADGTEEGPTDFRIAKLDLKNQSRLRADTIKVDGRFRLPGFGAENDPPPTSFATNTSVFTPTDEFTGAELGRIAEVVLQISDFPGNEFVFGVSNQDTSPIGRLEYNGAQQSAPSVKIGPDGRVLTWKYKSNAGNGKFTVDLAAGTFNFKLGAGTIRETFEPLDFLVAFTLRTADDVGQDVPRDQSFFHRELLIDAQATNVPSGRGVKTRGEGVPGGTLFLDGAAVKRKLKVTKGVPAPAVSSDDVTLAGTLRICPGSTPPSTPTITGDLVFGDIDLRGMTLDRKGRKGSKYAFKTGKGVTPRVGLKLDVVKGTFVVKIKGAAPLTQLVDADFSGTSATNDSKLTVGGMTVPFLLSVARVYEAEYDVPVVRNRGGKKFSR